jgi:hypothetical protein
MIYGTKIMRKRTPRRQTHEWFINKATAIHGTNFSYLTKYNGLKQKITIKCNKCGRIKEILPSSHLHPTIAGRCPSCAAIARYKTTLHKRKTRFYKQCNKTHKNKYQYFDDYINTRSKIKVYCTIHQEVFLIKAGSHVEGQGCSLCYSSIGETIIRDFLIKHNIEYHKEYSFANCNSQKGFPLRFDFYLPAYNSCIEYDGLQHFQQVRDNTREGFLYRQLNDKIKDEFCKTNNIKLIRINYKQQNQIYPILNGELLS